MLVPRPLELEKFLAEMLRGYQLEIGVTYIP
jgi:hypothetical protein